MRNNFKANSVGEIQDTALFLSYICPFRVYLKNIYIKNLNLSVLNLKKNKKEFARLVGLNGIRSNIMIEKGASVLLTWFFKNILISEIQSPYFILSISCLEGEGDDIIFFGREGSDRAQSSETSCNLMSIKIKCD